MNTAMFGRQVSTDSFVQTATGRARPVRAASAKRFQVTTQAVLAGAPPPQLAQSSARDLFANNIVPYTAVEAITAEEYLQHSANIATTPMDQPDSVFTKAWTAYQTALDTNPVMVKSATSFFGFLFGDLLAQHILGGDYDAWRTARLVLFGMLMDGPIGHVWYTTLDSKVMPEDPKCNKAVVMKMAADQFIWAPFFTCVFFSVQSILEGHPGAALPAIHEKLAPTLAANYALWPLAHIVNFKFIPSSQRILYINCVTVLWSAYLSNLAAVGLGAHGLH